MLSRTLGSFSSKKRKKPPDDPGETNTHCRAELDSHADTCAFGDCCTTLQDTGKRVNIGDFREETTTTGKVVSLAICWDDPRTGQTYLQVYHQSLYVPGMETHLLNPLQMQQNAICVEPTPMHLLPPSKRTIYSHSIYSTEHSMHIPLDLRGVMSGFTCRKPTALEVSDPDAANVTVVHMTLDSPWEPASTELQVLEEAIRDNVTTGLESDTTLQVSRDLSSIQVGGEDNGATDDASIGSLDSMPLELDQPLDAFHQGPSLHDPGGNAPGDLDISDEATILMGNKSFRGHGLGGEATLKSMQREQEHHAALEVDRYAETLMSLASLSIQEPALNALGTRLASLQTTKKRPGFVDAKKLAKNWSIGLKAAARTIDATTQMAVRDFSDVSGKRRLKPHHTMMDWKRIQGTVYTDTLYGPCKSLSGKTHSQVYATDYQYVQTYSMEREKDAHLTLQQFFSEVGVPNTIVSDGAKAETQGEFAKLARKAQCQQHPVEAYTPNLNKAEGTIRELKQHYTKVMFEKGVPEVLWDRCLDWCSNVRRHTAFNIPKLDGRTPHSLLTGECSDISNAAENGFFDWVTYIDRRGHLGLEGMKTHQRRRIGKYLGPSENHGGAMCGMVLTERGQVLHRTSIMPLTVEQENSERVQQLKDAYNAILEAKLKHRMATMKAGKPDPELESEFEEASKEWKKVGAPEHVPYRAWDPYELGFDIEKEPKDEPLPELLEADDMDVTYDKYIAAKVALPRDSHTFATGRVVARARDEMGELIGRSNPNPLLDNSVYEVQFEDGAVERYHANIIAEHIYAQIDGEGYTKALLDEIIDHSSDATAIPRSEGLTSDGRVKKTTRGWKLLVRWKDQSTEWIKLKDLKESHPVELAEYADANLILDEPAFKWWAPFTLRRRNRILRAMKTRYQRTTQKFGMELPKTVKRALEIDRETGTTFWHDASKKEMGTVRVAFDVLPEGAPKPEGREFIDCHVVFDIKQGTLQRKCRFVADGSRADVSNIPTYASVVSRESVRIAFTLAALNGLDVMAGDCEGAYLNAQSREKLYTKCGPEFGPELEGRWALIVRALYGSKSAAASWRSAISEVTKDLGFTMCRADNDVWMRPAEKANGDKVYEYVLVYSDGLLVVGLFPQEILKKIGAVYKLKKESVKEPDQYLGADIGKMMLADGKEYWFMSSSSYCKAALENVEAWLNKKKERLPTKTACVFPSNWKPELDVTPELDAENASWYQQQIGVLRWLVELGRLDICAEVSMLAAFSACPRQGHLAAVLHLFAYLKGNPRSKLVFDPTPMDHEPLELPDWSDFYGKQEELIPPDMPEPRGNPIQTTAFVDSDHAGDVVTRRSRTGLIVFCGSAPIVFKSKKQGSIETSSFGSELSAMKTAVEVVEGLRYKLRMMGVPLEGPTHIKADNMSVVHNCSNPSSQLKKKSNSIAFHYVRERCAMVSPVCCVSYINTKDNVADMFTKSQPGPTRKRLAEMVLF